MGAWAWALLLLLLPFSALIEAQYCTVNQTQVSVEENTRPLGPLVDITVPDDQQLRLGTQSTPGAFRVEENQLYLNVTPDYEVTQLLEAELECISGGTVVTWLRVFLTVLDVNDNEPEFLFKTWVEKVPEDTKVNTTIIPASTLRATDKDENDILFYSLRDVTPDAGSFFSLAGVNQPDLKLIRPLQFREWTNITLELLVRDTEQMGVLPSHSATATLALEVQPVDLRPPWFLPCAYVDTHVCVHAQYHGEVPTGKTMADPLLLSPGPIYAVDGDWGISMSIQYSIMTGDPSGFFSIDAHSGNLSLLASIPSPQTFVLLVKAEQVDGARYSVTQATVQALDPSGNPSFPLRLYRGFLVLGHGEGVAVKDAADPSQPLTIRAKDPLFPVYDKAFIYHVTNDSNFRMEGESVLSTATLVTPRVYFLEVEANNTETGRSASVAVEVQVSPEPTAAPADTPSPGTPVTDIGTVTRTVTQPMSGTVTQPVTGTVTQPVTGTVTQPATGTATLPVTGTVTQPATGTVTQSATGTVTQPVTGTVTQPVTGTVTQPVTGTVTQPVIETVTQPVTGSGPVTQPMTGTVTGTTQLIESGTRTQSVIGTVTPPVMVPGPGMAEALRFSAVHMAALGGVLGALLLLALIALVVLVHKHYGHRLRCCPCCSSNKALSPPSGQDNQAFEADGEDNWAPSDPSLAPSDPGPPETPEAPEPPSVPSSPSPSSPEAPARAEGSPLAVRSILTKERRPEGGYKAVWFGDDIGAEADVVVLNVPVADAGHSDSGDDGDDGDTEDERNRDSDSTYI